MKKYFLLLTLVVSGTLCAAERNQNNLQPGNGLQTPPPSQQNEEERLMQRLVDYQAREQEARDRARVARANQPVRRRGINDQEGAIRALEIRDRQARLNQNLNFALPDEGFGE